MIPVHVARSVLEAVRGDGRLYAATSLMLLAGHRKKEVGELRVGDWMPGDEPKIKISGRFQVRTIIVARTAADAVNAQLEESGRDADDPLLPGFQESSHPHRLAWEFKRVMRREGLGVTPSNLRKAAMTVAVNNRVPIPHIVEYFGLSAKVVYKELVPVPSGFDREIADLLERTFVT